MAIAEEIAMGPMNECAHLSECHIVHHFVLFCWEQLALRLPFHVDRTFLFCCFLSCFPVYHLVNPARNHTRPSITSCALDTVHYRLF